MAGVDEGASGRLGGAGRLVVLLRGSHGAQGGFEVAGGEEIAAVEPLTGDASLAKFPVQA